jgi:hypothetical protein
VDICRLLCAGKAHGFTNALDKVGLHIQGGDTFKAIWDSRFRTLAAAPIKRVSIVDRFAMGQHMVCPQAQLSGLERFLRLLDADADGSRHVTIFSAWTSDLHDRTLYDLECEIRLIAQRLPAKNVKGIKLNMLPNPVFGDLSHDRFVRFNNYVWELGIGLKIFEGAFAAERSSASFKTGASVNGYRQVENDLVGHPNTRTVEIR